jgi:hypothetical protein
VRFECDLSACNQRSDAARGSPSQRTRHCRQSHKIEDFSFPLSVVEVKVRMVELSLDRVVDLFDPGNNVAHVSNHI